jgi:UDP-glucuronate 4-epimerase
MVSKRILITGAAGFIGFHVALALQARGDEVVGLDNFNDYYDPSLKKERAKLLALKGVNIIEGDVCAISLLQHLFEEKSFTHIVHLAAQAGVRYSLINPQAYIKANIDGFLSILELCRQYPHVPLIYASSSSVYGTNTKIPFAVDDRTDGQASFYGVTKKTNELMAYTYHHLYGISVTGLRFFTVYGPWGRPDMAYFSFTKAILEDKPIDVYHYGDMQRDFTYIDDIVAGVIAAIDLAAPCEIFNLGNHRPEPLALLISAIEESLGKKAHKHYLPMQPGDVEVTYADIESSQQKLGFIPKVTLQNGIQEFVKWYVEFIH